MYQAFISYRHNTSGAMAVALEKALRQYAKPLYKPPIRIFRDENQIGAGQDLKKTIRQALQESIYLIYIATRDAAESPYVRQELELWCGELKRQDRLIIIWQKDKLLADPVRNSLAWESSDAIPSSLKSYLSGIPVWLDFTWVAGDSDLVLNNPRFKTLINSIVSRFRGIPPENLIGEEVITHRRNVLIRNTGITALGIMLIIALTAGWVAYQQRNTAVVERDRARSSLLVNASNKLRRWDSTMALRFAAEAYGLNISAPSPMTDDAILRAFYEHDSDTMVPYRRRLPHGSEVTAVNYSPDQKLLATGTSDGFLRLWSSDGRLIKVIPAHRFKVLSTEFAFNSEFIVTTSLFGTEVKLWGLDGASLDTLPFEGGEFTFAKTAPNNGTILVSFGGENYRHGFRLWNLSRDSSILLPSKSTRELRSTLLEVAFSRNSEYIIGLFREGSRIDLDVWSRNGKRIRRPQEKHSDSEASFPQADNPVEYDARFNAPTFGANVVYRHASSVRRWDEVQIDKSASLVHFSVSPDGQLFLRRSLDGIYRIWDDRGGLLSSFTLPDDIVASALIGNDGSLVTQSRSALQKVSLRDRNGKLIKTLRGHSAPITAIRISPDSKTLLTASKDTTVKLWMLEDEFAPVCKTELEDVSALYFSPKAQRAALIVSANQRAYLWRFGEIDKASELAQEEGVVDASYSADGNLILTTHLGRRDLSLWDSAGSLVTHCCSHEETPANAVFSPGGRHLMTVSRDGAVKLWTVQGALLATLVDKGEKQTHAVFAPTGKRIITYGSVSGTRLWNMQGKPLPSALTSYRDVVSVRFSPAGDRLLLDSAEGGSLWSGEGNQLLRELETQPRTILSANWLSDGSALVSSHPRGGIKVWDKNGVLLHAWDMPMESQSFSVDPSPDNSSLVINAARIRTLDGISMGKLDNEHMVSMLADSRYMITASGHILNHSSWESAPSEFAIRDSHGGLVARLGHIPGWIKSAVTSPDGRLVGILSETGTLAIRCTPAGIYHNVKDAEYYQPSIEERNQSGIDW
jgi:WD40 repeat protein